MDGLLKLSCLIVGGLMMVAIQMGAQPSSTASPISGKRVYSEVTRNDCKNFGGELYEKSIAGVRMYEGCHLTPAQYRVLSRESNP